MTGIREKAIHQCMYWSYWRGQSVRIGGRRLKMKKEKVLPCMWCGSTAHVRTYKPMYGQFEGNYMCECSTCGIHTAGDCDTPEEAIANWNEDMATPRMRPMTLAECREFVYDLEDQRIGARLALLEPEPEEGVTYSVPDGGGIQ
jgi:hypothetical protein